MFNRDPFETLGTFSTGDASQDARLARQAYIRLLSQYHPDQVSSTEQAAANALIAEISNAFQQINEGDKLERYYVIKQRLPDSFRSASSPSPSASAAVLAASASSSSASAASATSATTAAVKIPIYIPIFVYKVKTDEPRGNSVNKEDLTSLREGGDSTALFERLSRNIDKSMSQGTLIRVGVDRDQGLMAGLPVDLDKTYEAIMLLAVNIPIAKLTPQEGEDFLLLKRDAKITVNDIVGLEPSIANADASLRFTIQPPEQARAQRIAQQEISNLIANIAEYINTDRFWVKAHGVGKLSMRVLPKGIEAMRRFINDPACDSKPEQLLINLKLIAQAHLKEQPKSSSGFFGFLSGKKVDPHVFKPLKVQFYELVLESKTLEEVYKGLRDKLCGPIIHAEPLPSSRSARK
jgi:hypothetical protein